MPRVARLPRINADPEVARVQAGPPWPRVLIWLIIIGAALGTAYRRPTIFMWSQVDTIWSCVFGLTAALLIVPYLLWQRRTAFEYRAFLAKLGGTSLFVFPRPGIEQHVPLLGAVALKRGHSGGGRTEIVVERAGANDDSHLLDLDAEDAQRVIEFANQILTQMPRKASNHRG